MKESAWDKLVDAIITAIDERIKKPTTSYSDKAQVLKVDKDRGIAWVHIPGGEPETPAKLTIDAKAGDVVQVSVSNHKATLTGNMSAPPTDDTVAKEANEKATKNKKKIIALEDQTGLIHKEAAKASEGNTESTGIEWCLANANAIPVGQTFEDIRYTPWSADIPAYVAGKYYWMRTKNTLKDGTEQYSDPVFDLAAQAGAEADVLSKSINNHFWYDNTGAWVTEEEDDNTTGYATGVKAQGIIHTYDGKTLFALTSSALTFYKSDGETPMAWYGSSGIGFAADIPYTIGNQYSYIKWINTGTDQNPSWKLQINADVIQFGGADVATTDMLNLYSIETNVDWITYDPNNSTLTPSTLNISTYNDGITYAGRIRIKGSTDGTTWTTLYTSSSNESSKSYSLSSSYAFYSITLYAAGGTSTVLQTKTIPVIDDGANGSAGKGISSIQKTGTSGKVDTYTITYTDGTTSTYTVTNGEDVTSQYVTTISGYTGITVHAANDTSNFAQFNSNGMTVYMSGNISAQFGRTITLYGRDNNGNVKSTVTIDSSGANINGFKIQTTTYTSGTFTECESSNGLRLIGAGTTLGLYSTQATLDRNLHISGVIDSFNVHQVASTCPTSRNTLKTTYTELILENYTSDGALVLGDYLSIIPWDEGFSYSGIKCLKAGYVLVSAAVHFFDVNDSNVCALKISAGSTDVAEAKARSSGDRTEIVIPPRLVSVNANTIIHLYVANTTTAAGYAGGNSSSLSAEDKRKNYLTVQYV